MARLNVSESGVMGSCIMARGAMGLDFGDQDIPAVLLDEYTMISALARDPGYIGKRYPWMVKQPLTPDQQVQFDKFRDGVDAFNALTPEEREWWYEQSQGSGLFYFNYFMQDYLNSH